MVIAGFAAFAGVIASLAGLYGVRRIRRIEHGGVRSTALVKRAPGAASGDLGPPRPLLQFTTKDEQVVEIVSPVPPTRRRPLRDGETVLVIYDPQDPGSVVVLGRERIGLEYGFVLAGVVVSVAAIALIALAVVR